MSSKKNPSASTASEPSRSGDKVAQFSEPPSAARRPKPSFAPTA